MHAGHWTKRRRLIQGAGALVSLGLAARAGATGRTVAADAPGADATAARPSPLVMLDAPAVADNGAVVPITVSSALPGTREIVLLVQINPEPVALRFAVPEGTEPFVATRIRMVASGTVHAVVRTDLGLFCASRAVEVSVGGCG